MLVSRRLASRGWKGICFGVKTDGGAEVGALVTWCLRFQNLHASVPSGSRERTLRLTVRLVDHRSNPMQITRPLNPAPEQCDMILMTLLS